MEKPLIYVIIVTQNGKTLLEKCIPSVLNTAYPNFKLLLVDNCSTDGSQEMVKSVSRIELIQLQSNKGFAEANNIGLEYALKRNAKYLALLNNDTVVAEDWLEKAVRAFEADKNIGIVGFNLIHEETPGNEADFEKALAKKAFDEVKNVAYLFGAALVLRASMLKQIGLFDRTYFYYSEEMDLEKRAVRAGYRLAKVSTPILHFGSVTALRTPFKSCYLDMRNRMRCSIKNEGFSEFFSTIVFLLNYSCNPFFDVDTRKTPLKRLRPGNFLVNFIILLTALLWNLCFLPETLIARHRDYTRIKKMKEAGVVA